MARQADVFDDIESSAERMADWVRRNAVALGIGVVLLISGVWGVQAWRQGASDRADAASAALAEVRIGYQRSMGVDPTTGEVPELANPEAGERIETEYREGLRAVAEAHPGSTAGVLARLEVLEIEEAEVGPEQTLAGLGAILESLPRGSGLRGVVMLRQAGVQEDAGSLEAASATYEALSQMAEYPLRDFALADAARCAAQSGDPARALELYEALEARSPDFGLPDEHRTLKRELLASADR